MATVSTILTGIESFKYLGTVVVSPTEEGVDVIAAANASDFSTAFAASRYVTPILRQTSIPDPAVDVYVNNAASAVRLPAASTEAMPLMTQLNTTALALFDETETSEVTVDFYGNTI